MCKKENAIIQYIVLHSINTCKFYLLIRIKAYKLRKGHYYEKNYCTGKRREQINSFNVRCYIVGLMDVVVCANFLKSCFLFKAMSLKTM